MMTAQPAFSRRTYWPFLLLLAVAAVGVYGQLLVSSPITWDDDSNIFKNPYYAANLWSQFWIESYFGLYVPVTSTVWQVLYTIGNGAALPYRILNLVLHLANGFLVFLLLRSLSTRWNLKSATAIIVGTAIFLLHPLQDQAVNWISGGRDLLSAFFALLCVYIFFCKSGLQFWIAATLLFALSILSKPGSVVLVGLLPMLAFIVDRARLKESLVLAAVWLVPAAFSIYMSLSAQSEFLISLKWWERLLVAADAYTFYIQKFFVPYPLSANYDRQPAYVLARWAPYLRALALLILIPILRWAWHRDRRYLLALGWFALLLPVSGIVSFGYQKISTTANHYHYLPMAAAAALVMLSLNRWPAWEAVARRGLLPFIVLLTFLANARAQVWKNDVNFFENMAEYAPEAYSTALGMSVVKCAQQNNYADGLRWTQVALRERPLDILALANQAYCYLHAKDFTNLVQMELYLHQLDLNEMEHKQPTAYSSFLASVGTGLYETGHQEDGFQFLCEAYRVLPSGENNLRNLQTGTQLIKQKTGVTPKCITPFPGAKLVPAESEKD